MEKAYNPQQFEDEIYKRWEESGYFNPDKIDSDDKYCNILPPPNANGELHLGHASGYAVMDILGRYQRMKGKKVLLLPGKDHAGIQTQVVYEKKIEKEKGLSRHDLGREKFYQEVYDFCIDRSDYMRVGEKKIGLSADWNREKFTLDPDVLRIALETFVQLYNDGLIYKGKRIINWCPRCGSALSDVEVIHKEEPGKLFFIKYPIENSEKFITVATTRPETMLGDSAVAVNPDDDRHKNIVGKNVILPLINRRIPIIADKRIETEFGSGAVKITPAHDPLDWEIGRDHNLPEIQVIDEQAEITELGGDYKGLGVSEARNKILADLKKEGLLEKTEEITHSVSSCERCKSIIEPLTSDQWFISVDNPKISLKKLAIDAIETNRIEIYPENFRKILINWFSNLRDWCISRQIWWGPRFPVWYRNKEIKVSIEKPEGEGWIQDENTLDTWFTSGQWPHTTLKSKPGDFESFYPTDMMVMGRDLLFFWSARMIMLGIYRNKEVPFKKLYFTGLIRDKEGRKMSKSRGNGIEALDMIEKYGADALRLSLVMDTAPGQDARLYEEKIEGFRNLVNKVWNISRYIISKEIASEIKLDDIDQHLLTDADKYILSEFEVAKNQVVKKFEKFDFSGAGTALNVFTWNYFADWYLEASKIEKNQEIKNAILKSILIELLKLWHPFMPFVTEAIWKELGKDDLLMTQGWPNYKDIESKDMAAIGNFTVIKQIIETIRNLRAENKISYNQKINVIIDIKNRKETMEMFGSVNMRDLIDTNKELIRGLRTGIESIEILETGEKIDNSIYRVVNGINIFIPLEGLIDTEKEAERKAKEIESLEKYITSLSGKLENKEFIEKAPEKVVTQEKAKLEEAKNKLEELRK